MHGLAVVMTVPTTVMNTLLYGDRRNLGLNLLVGKLNSSLFIIFVVVEYGLLTVEKVRPLRS